jgi:hypothetical protein
MSDVTFDRLTDRGLREAWLHEERDFTPWLMENIDHIGDAIGIPLEAVGREIRVGPFEADIVAINPQDGTRVLIENQLEPADHRHLGQIMTYLAGLEISTVIWIAPRFSDEHLSAIKWLNDNTTERFSFFAVKLRVVQIADSPLAPILEVVQKPNGWERQLAAARRQTAGDSVLGDARLAFWRDYIARCPAAEGQGIVQSRLSYSWCPVIDGSLYVSVFVGTPKSGLFVRGPYGGDHLTTTELLEPYEEQLSERLQAPWGGSNGKFLARSIPLALDDIARRAELIDRLEETRIEYTRVLRAVLGGEA